MRVCVRMYLRQRERVSECGACACAWYCAGKRQGETEGLRVCVCVCVCVRVLASQTYSYHFRYIFLFIIFIYLRESLSPWLTNIISFPDLIYKWKLLFYLNFTSI